MSTRKGNAFGPLRTRAIVLRDAMMMELPADIRSNLTDKFAEDVLKNGMLAGVYPVTQVADYLERLARSLPE